jgi:hypothetical protein
LINIGILNIEPRARGAAYRTRREGFIQRHADLVLLRRTIALYPVDGDPARRKNR